MTKTATIALSALLGAALAMGWFWWQGGRGSIQPRELAVAASAPPAAPAPAAPSAPAILHPVPAVAALRAAASIGLDVAFIEPFGHQSVSNFFRTDDFARRVVATIDNLGRSSAPASTWPVNPAKGRFGTIDTGKGEIIQADNSVRYVPYVLLLEQLDLQRAVQVYTEHYPTLQREYEELGFPHRYFNDRFIDVLDQMLATPESPPQMHVHRPAINGVQPTRPWLLYEFDDPALQSISAGQRTLMRMGSVNERRVKARLMELRRLLATGNTEETR